MSPPYCNEFTAVLQYSIDILSGTSSADKLSAVAASCGLDTATCNSLAEAAGELVWEFAKSGTNVPETISAILQQLGIPASISTAFATVLLDSFRFDYFMTGICSAIIRTDEP
jgi:hypothetical protein